MKRSAWRRMRRNCHHFRTIRYQDTIENTTRIASTNCVSALDVLTSSHGVVGIARPTWSTTASALLFEPPECGRESFGQAGARHPAQLALRLRGIERVALQLAGPRRRAPHIGTAAGGFR